MKVFTCPVLAACAVALATVNGCRTEADKATIANTLIDELGNSDDADVKARFRAGVLRLVFHDAGTYDLSDDTGGASGCIEFTDADNSGLQIVVDMLEPFYQQFKELCPSRADFWALAGAAAVDASLPSSASTSLVSAFTWGRDAEDNCLYKSGRMPGHQDSNMEALTSLFSTRMGFTTKEIVTLMGAHTMGRGHAEASGFQSAWTQTPNTFDNRFFVDLVDGQWARARVVSPVNDDVHNFYVDPRFLSFSTGTQNMMLNTDMVLAWDTTTKEHCHVQWPEAFAPLVIPFKSEWEVIVSPPGTTDADLLCDAAASQPLNTRSVVESYAESESSFHTDFNLVYHKLVGLGYGNGTTRGELCAPCTNVSAIGQCCCRSVCVDPKPPVPDTPEPESKDSEAPTSSAGWWPWH